jgi:hypothetical protein
MKYEFDANITAHERPPSIYEAEYKLMKELLKSDRRTLCFTYEFSSVAESAYSMLRREAIKNGMPFRVKRRGAKVFVLKESESIGRS